MLDEQMQWLENGTILYTSPDLLNAMLDEMAEELQLKEQALKVIRKVSLVKRAKSKIVRLWGRIRRLKVLKQNYKENLLMLLAINDLMFILHKCIEKWQKYIKNCENKTV